MNWDLIIILTILAAALAIAIVRFFKLSSAEQMDKVKEWLLQAVIAAEAAYGGGTGRLKLSTVYDAFCKAFPWLVKIITVNEFNELVDEALITMRQLLEQNNAIAEVVYK